MARWATICLCAIMAYPAATARAAGQSSSANGSAQAQIVAPLTVTPGRDLDFGSIFAASSAGSVTVSPDGAIAYQGGTQSACIGGSCAGAHAAEFDVRGAPDRSYLISVPSEIAATGTALAPLTSPPPPLLVGSITVRSDSRPNGGAVGRLDGQGRDHFTIGGTLRAPANLVPARYRAIVPVIVTYN